MMEAASKRELRAVNKLSHTEPTACAHTHARTHTHTHTHARTHARMDAHRTGMEH